MADRFHLFLAIQMLSAGIVLAWFDSVGPDWLRRHLLAAAGVLAAVSGLLVDGRAWLWVLVAAPLLIWPDRPDPPDGGHPLGRWTVLLCVAGLAGVWAAVPDTEPPLAAAMVLLPIAGSRAATRRGVGDSGTLALVVAVLGAVWVGSAGWGSALASVCAVGLVAVAPAVLGFGRVLDERALRALAVAHLGVVLVVPRLVMRWPVTAAWTVSLLSLVALGAWAVSVGRRSPELEAS